MSNLEENIGRNAPIAAGVQAARERILEGGQNKDEQKLLELKAEISGLEARKEEILKNMAEDPRGMRDPVRDEKILADINEKLGPLHAEEGRLLKQPKKPN